MSLIVKLNKLFFRLIPRSWKQQPNYFSTASVTLSSVQPKEDATQPKEVSERVVMFRNTLRAKTPIGKLDELDEFTVHPNHETEPLKPWPNGVNPHTGEVGGPAGPEPTRYGDWERKGRVTDF